MFSQSIQSLNIIEKFLEHLTKEKKDHWIKNTDYFRLDGQVEIAMRKNCIKQSLQNERKRKYCCAFCRSEIGTFEMYNESIKDEFTNLISSGEESTSVRQI